MSSYAVKERTLEGFGQRLADIRKDRGVTQEELGRLVGVSNRVICYYEQDGSQPPGALLVELARALKVSADDLLGLAPERPLLTRKTAFLLKRLQRVELLPSADQKAVLKFVDALLQTRGITNGDRPTQRKRSSVRRKSSTR